MPLLTQSAFVDEEERAALDSGFFNGGLSLAPLSVDGLFIALPRLADRALWAPAQPPQDLPDVGFVVVDPELVLDQPSHPRASLQRPREAMCFGTLQQQRHQAFPLHGVQQRLASGAHREPQCGRSLLQVLPSPHTDGLPRNLQPPGRFRLMQPLVE